MSDRAGCAWWLAPNASPETVASIEPAATLVRVNLAAVSEQARTA